MKKISAMGELLIDFVPFDENNPGVFEQKLGGAPANVASVVAILGGKSTFYGQVGKDKFGDFLIEGLSKYGVNTKYIQQTPYAKTGLTFVELDKKGNRSFNFYRNPSADMLYSKEDYLNNSETEDIFVFSSVSLIDYPIKDTHLEAIKRTKENNGLLVFDANIRKHLWSDFSVYRKIIFDFIFMVDIVKIADDEISWLTETRDLSKAIQIIKNKGIKMIILTKGKDGAVIYINQRIIDVPGFEVKTVDTTGAGDAFLGAFLFQLSIIEIPFDKLPDTELERILQFANAVAAISTTKKGAVAAIPSLLEVNDFLGI